MRHQSIRDWQLGVTALEIHLACGHWVVVPSDTEVAIQVRRDQIHFWPCPECTQSDAPMPMPKLPEPSDITPKEAAWKFSINLPPLPDISCVLEVLNDVPEAEQRSQVRIPPQPERPKYSVDMLLLDSETQRLCSRCKRPLRRGDVIVTETKEERQEILVVVHKLIICIECGRGPMLAAWDQYDALMRERRIAEEANEKRGEGR